MEREISVEEFDRRHGLRLARFNMRARAKKIFKDFGPILCWKMDKLFENALKHNKVPQVVNMLEETWEEHLVKLEPLIDRNVAIMFLVDNVYARHFREAIEKELPGIRFIDP